VSLSLFTFYASRLSLGILGSCSSPKRLPYYIDLWQPGNDAPINPSAGFFVGDGPPYDWLKYSSNVNGWWQAEIQENEVQKHEPDSSVRGGLIVQAYYQGSDMSRYAGPLVTRIVYVDEEKGEEETRAENSAPLGSICTSTIVLWSPNPTSPFYPPTTLHHQ